MPYAWMPVRPVGCRWVGDSSHKPLCMCCHFGCVCVCRKMAVLWHCGLDNEVSMIRVLQLKSGEGHDGCDSMGYGGSHPEP